MNKTINKKITNKNSSNELKIKNSTSSNVTNLPASIQRHHSANPIQNFNQISLGANSTNPRTINGSLNQVNQAELKPISRSNSFDSCSAHSPKLDYVPTHASNTPTTSTTIPTATAAAPPTTSSSSSLNSIVSSCSNSVTSTTIFDPLPHLPSRLRQATLKLVPPPNFGFIEESLFRSGEPAELSLNFIQRLNLHSLLWLAPQPASVKFQEFLTRNSIQFHNLGIQHAASLDAVTDEAVTHALELILNPTIYPLMIMCAGGSHRTGTVVGCLRKLQGWNLASIFEEYRRYAGAQHHFMNEQFIEFYNLKRLINHITKEEITQSYNNSNNNITTNPNIIPNEINQLMSHHPSTPTTNPSNLNSDQETPPKFKIATPSSSLSF